MTAIGQCEGDGETPSILQTCSYKVTFVLDDTFYRLGRAVGARPWLTIILSLSLCAISLLGCANISQNSDLALMFASDEQYDTRQQQVALGHFSHHQLDSAALVRRPGPRYFQDTESSRVKRTAGGMINHDENYRLESLMVVSEDNVLSRSSILDLMKIYQTLMNVSSADSGHTFEDLCVRYIDDADESAVPQCLSVVSLLSFWGYNPDIIAQLTDEEILGMVRAIDQL